MFLLFRPLIFLAAVVTAFSTANDAEARSLTRSLNAEVVPYLPMPRPPGDDCDAIPQAEQEKFEGCGLKIFLKRQQEEKEARERAKKAVQDLERSTWAWLNTPPRANCNGVPLSEYKKFSCVPESERQRRELSIVLGEIRQDRRALAEQIRQLKDRDSRLLQEAPTLISPEQTQRLELVERINSVVSNATAKRALLSELGKVMQQGLPDIGPVEIRFATATSNRPLFRDELRDAEIVGRIREGELLIVLDAFGRSDMAAIVGSVGGLSYVSRESIIQLSK